MGKSADKISELETNLEERDGTIEQLEEDIGEKDELIDELRARCLDVDSYEMDVLTELAESAARDTSDPLRRRAYQKLVDHLKAE
jgi:peptidoglycan hydrolase CwlO-like protein